MRDKSNERFKVQIRNYTFYISLFCFKKVGDTENMKFRLECEQNSQFSGEFDDFESLKNYLAKFMQEELFDYMVMTA